MPIYEYPKLPQATIAPDVFMAPTAQVIGDVRVGTGSSLWFGTVLRGDVMPIIIGENSNIQDNTVIHGTWKKAQTEIGDQVTVGHSCVLHGSKIGSRCLIGMGSILMDDSKIPSDCIVGAGSLVTENSEFEEGYLIMGRPAKAIRKLNEKERNFLKQSAKNYSEYMTWFEQ